MAPLLFLSFFLLLSVASSTHHAPHHAPRHAPHHTPPHAPPPGIGSFIPPPPPPPPDPALFRVGFYNTSCPQAESAIRSVVQKHFAKDPSISAGLLRMMFHDCFVGGCDASVLIQPTKEPHVETELSSDANTALRGFDIIDEAKAAVEAVCPSTVSCADIVALTARDGVALAGGLDYPMPTGRRDSLEPHVQDVFVPFAREFVFQVVSDFGRKGLTAEDLVVLLGAHTIGRVHCSSIYDRLFKFSQGFVPQPHQGNGSDPNMDPGLKAHLIEYCGPEDANPSEDKVMNLDLQTPFQFDNNFYKQLLDIKGIIQLDQALTLDKFSAPLVKTLASDGALFLKKFADALVKMASMEVLVGHDGEIRKNCGVPNKPAS